LIDLRQLMNSLEAKVMKIVQNKKNMNQREIDLLTSEIKYLEAILARIRESGAHDK
jgi:hypothetical protein